MAVWKLSDSRRQQALEDKRQTRRCLVRSRLGGPFALAYGALAEEEIALVEATKGGWPSRPSRIS